MVTTYTSTERELRRREPVVQIIMDETAKGSLELLKKLPDFGHCERAGEGVYFVLTTTPDKVISEAELCEAVIRAEVV